MPRQSLKQNFEKPVKNSNAGFPSFKKIATGFIVLAVVLVIFIVYFSFAKATITLTVSEAPRTENFSLTVSATTTDADLVGRFISKEITLNQSYTVEKFQEEPAVATGKIKIVNNSPRNQTLIKTTRFLSANNILFRLSNTVVVPAGKELVADVYADQAGVAGNIAPGKFTIPGLSADLQTKIYGISETAMTGGTKKIGLLAQSDIDQAWQSFNANLNQLIKDNLKSEVKEGEILSENLMQNKILTQEVLAKVGDKVEKFSLRAKISVQTVLINSDILLEAAKSAYQQKAGPTMQIASWQPETLTGSLKSLDVKNSSAELAMALTAKLSGSFDLSQFNKKEITGFDKKGVEYYFSQFPSVKKIEIDLWPFWVRSVPALEERIEIIIK